MTAFHHSQSRITARDIIVGNATIVWSAAGWRLPGGGTTTDYTAAHRAATLIARIIG